MEDRAPNPPRSPDCYSYSPGEKVGKSLKIWYEKNFHDYLMRKNGGFGWRFGFNDKGEEVFLILGKQKSKTIPQVLKKSQATWLDDARRFPLDTLSESLLQVKLRGFNQ